MPTHAISLCKTDCWLRLSHFSVTPDQFVSVMVPWSFLSSRQQTRAPMLKVLDWVPVIRFAVSSRFDWGDTTVAAQRADCHDTLEVSAALMCGTCSTTSAGPRMSKTSPQGHFMKRLHGLPGP
jgi:hypothetical protein